ncbi:MAG: glycoside hydrolase family 15 protein [Actinomycetota bacterium]
MNRIGDYALIGDCHSAALVGRDGSVDWACFPRFDSPAVFCKALDEARGGSFEVSPQDVRASRRQYVEGTNVLETTFDCSAGVLELTDCMPIAEPHRVPARMRAHGAILRRLRCLEGTVDVRISVSPRFEYGRFVPLFRLTSEETAEAVGGGDALHITATRHIDESDERITASWRLRAGEVEWIEAGWGPSHRLRRAGEVPTRAEFEHRLAGTIAFFTDWSSRCRLVVADPDAVLRSALTLKALTYAPTGAILAAPTTSLPEEIGGERNWDYRYTWIRDGTLSLISLFSLGVREEAEAFKFWMERTSAGRCEDLQIMYGIGGERSLPEFVLDHLAGHRGSAPVRIGNGAAKQLQLDAYGQLIEAVYLFAKPGGGRITPDNWSFVSGLADVVAETWRNPDQGMWEIRDEPRHFVHSKLNCWVALSRAVQLASSRHLPSSAQRWVVERDAIRAYLMQDAEERGWFSQAVGTDAPDASALLVPATGFLPTAHPLVQRTLDVVRSELGEGALLRRYRTSDGLEGGEGAFLLCSYWLLDCLIFGGRIDEAEAVLDQLHGYANDVGLWAEEVDPATGEALGNFPQAFTHMAHIRSCLHLEAARRGKIDHERAYDYDEDAVDRLIAGRRVASAGEGRGS